MGAWGIGHWIVVLLIVLVVFGTKKLRNIGEDLGGAVKGFKEGMKEAGADTPSSTTQNPQQVSGETIDVEVKDKTTSK